MAMYTDDPSEKSTRDIPITNNATEDTLPNEIKALSGRKFTGDELKTYGDAMGKKKKECYKSRASTTIVYNSTKLGQHVKIQLTFRLIFNATKKCSVTREKAPYYNDF